MESEKRSETRLNDAFKEAGERNKCDDGGYDLWKIEAFVAGAKVAIELEKDGKSPLVDIEEMIEGYKWALTNLDVAVVGTAFEEDHWQVTCPNCQKEFEYKGYFDSSDITNCKCGTSFKTSKIEFENGSYIQ